MRRSRATRLAAVVAGTAAVLGGAAATPQTEQKLPAYFAPGMPPARGGGGCPALPNPPASIPARWWQQINPPDGADSCQTFAFGPLTDASSQAVPSFSGSTWSGGLWPRVWAERGPRPPALGLGDPASNPIYPYIHTPTCADPGGPVKQTMFLGEDFSSVANANAATKAEILRMLGAGASTWQAPLIAQGFKPHTDFISYAALAADPGRFVRYRAGCNSHDGNSYVTIDKFIVHDLPGWVYVDRQSTPPTGVMIDYEVNDFRSPAEGAVFLADLATAIHAQSVGGVHPSAFLYTNPWLYLQLGRGLVGGMTANGFDFNHIDRVKSTFDYISLYLLDADFMCNVSGAFTTEIANLSGVSGVVDNSRLVVLVDLYRCHEQDVIDIFNLNRAQSFGGYAIFPKNQTMGGQGKPLTAANRLLWRLMYGTRTPPGG